MNYTKMNRGGREYLPAAHFMKKYELSASALRQAKKNGLPCIEERGVSYYNKQDFHDYFAGRIGNDVEGAAPGLPAAHADYENPEPREGDRE